MEIILVAPPEKAVAALRMGKSVAVMGYRVGPGGHLYRANLPHPLQGGLLGIDDGGFSGQADPHCFTSEVLKELQARRFEGVFCDFDQVSPTLGRLLEALAQPLTRQGKSLYIPEPYGEHIPYGKALVSSAVSGGTLEHRISEALRKYGRERVVVALEKRAEDFTLPSRGGSGNPLSETALQELRNRVGHTPFFSQELCAHYFTYMQGGAGHFVLFDTAGSLRRKLAVVEKQGVKWAVLPVEEAKGVL